MEIHVLQNGQQTGPYPIETVQQMIQTGSIQASDLGWHEGLTDWAPVGNLLPKPQAAGLRVSAPAPSHAPPIGSAVQSERYVPIQPIQPDNEPSDVSRILRAGIAGGVACLVGGGLWAALAIIAHIQLGILAWGIGALSGWAISHFGRGTGVVFQVMAVICALVGILIGKIGALIGLGFFPIGLFDVLWIIFAVGSAWKSAGGGD